MCFNKCCNNENKLLLSNEKNYILHTLAVYTVICYTNAAATAAAATIVAYIYSHIDNYKNRLHIYMYIHKYIYLLTLRTYLIY